MSDQKHQVIPSADVIGSVDERPSLEPMVQQTRSNLPEDDPFKTAKLGADSGFCRETNLKAAGTFTPKDFYVNPKTEVCTCPAGKKMWLKSRNPKTHGRPDIHDQAYVEDCKRCSYRNHCLRREDQVTPRQFAWFQTHLPEDQKYTKRMQQKIDTAEGKHEYSKRLGIIAPVFANITRTIGLSLLSLRGKKKVSAQWKLFCLVLNIGKIQQYGMAT